ncbi:hypothetical protein DSECCO2_16370 [anaerobic digester metagenome]
MISIAHRKKIAEKYAIVKEALIGTLESLGLLKSLKREEVQQVLGRDDIPCGGLLIPYPNNPECKTVRLDEPFASDITEKPRRYFKPVGQINQAYIPFELVTTYTELKNLWFVEGEMKALSLATKGLPVIGISGIYCWRCNNDSEKARFDKMLGSNKTSDIDDNEALIEELKIDFTGKIVTLIYDSDIDQEHPGWESYRRLAEVLYSRGAAQVRIFITPALEGLEKTGVDDFFAVGLKNNLSDEIIAENLIAQIEAIPAYLPKMEGAQQIVDKITLKGMDATREEKIIATAIILNRDGLSKATDFSQAFGSQKKSILDQAKAIKKANTKWYQKKYKTDDLDLLPKIIKQKIQANAEEKLQADLFKDELFEIIYRVFKNSGKFYVSDIGDILFHFKDKIMNMNTSEFEALFTNKTTLAAKSNDKGKNCLERMKAKVQEEGTRVIMHQGSYYSIKKKTLYIDIGKGKMLKIDGKMPPETVDVGTDEVLFGTRQYFQPLKYVEYDEDDITAFDRLMLGANFSNDSRVKPAHAKIILMAYFLAGIFRSLNPTRPILVSKGECGSGKTSLATNWLRILEGNEASVLSADFRNKEQISNILTNELWAVFDNVDGVIDGIEDMLASNATGSSKQTRVLYQTNQTIRYKMTAWPIITTRTPKFLRDDICDRIIPINLEQLAEKIPENKILAEIEEKRDKFFSIIVDAAAEIVKHIAEHGLSDQMETLRMADFGAFLRIYLKSMDSENGDALCDEICKELIQAQQFLLIDEDPVVEGLIGLLKNKLIEKGTPYKGTELLSKLRTEAKNNQIPFKINDVKELYSILAERNQAIFNIFGITIRPGNKNGSKTLTVL